MSGMKGAAEECSSLSSLFGSFYDTFMGQTELMTKDSADASSENSTKGAGTDELTKKTSSTDHVNSPVTEVDSPVAEAGTLSLIELETKKAQALADQCQGIECLDCIDDGKGNTLPAALVHSIEMQEMTTHINQFQAKKQGSSHDQKKRSMRSNDENTSKKSTTRKKMRLDFNVIDSPCRKLTGSSLGD